ncbi:hypothetical protein BD410DRAFT_828541 [Rickenella mellea]|uniref:F-box domain-containing protein n=1 Tax=Rickenella mellea TaxID=50990 RepID=A0A4Y7Q504_9AGAM|nr:hypothetical protein BD410DRAFT_828541 [Rickenella mellea]
MCSMRTTKNGATPIAGLENLPNLLIRLQSHGFQGTGGEVWDEILLNTNEPGSDTMIGTSPDGLRRSLDEAKTCIAALYDVGDKLRRKIRSLRRAYIPLAHEIGMKGLPDEIILQIFEAGYLMTSGWTFTRTVSQVSHRFRQISLNMPLLWTRISGRYSTDQVKRFLSQSRQMDLDISTRCSGLDLAKFLPRLGRHLNRITKLRYFDKKAASTMRDIGYIDLPQVETLHLHFDVYEGFSELKSLLRGLNDVSSPSLISHTQLTSFEFVANGRGNCVLDIPALAHAIYNKENLKHLSLTLDGCPHGDSGDLKIRDIHSVPIDSLQVTVKGRTGFDPLHSFYEFLSSLLPSTVHLTMEDVGEADTSKELFYLFVGDGGEVMFPYGSVIKITALGIDYRFWSAPDDLLLMLLVKNCKFVHTIHLEVGGMNFVSPSHSIAKDDWKHFSALRHLRFTRCDLLPEWELRALVTNLMIGAKEGEGLRSLEIFDCRGISEDCLLDLSDEVGSKLSWKLTLANHECSEMDRVH